MTVRNRNGASSTLTNPIHIPVSSGNNGPYPPIQDPQQMAFGHVVAGDAGSSNNTRARDLDEDNIVNILDNMETVKVSTAAVDTIIVEYDKKTGKHIVVDGHHRHEAFRRAFANPELYPRINKELPDQNIWVRTINFSGYPQELREDFQIDLNPQSRKPSMSASSADIAMKNFRRIEDIFNGKTVRNPNTLHIRKKATSAKKQKKISSDEQRERFYNSLTKGDCSDFLNGDKQYSSLPLQGAEFASRNSVLKRLWDLVRQAKRMPRNLKSYSPTTAKDFFDKVAPNLSESYTKLPVQRAKSYQYGKKAVTEGANGHSYPVIEVHRSSSLGGAVPSQAFNLTNKTGYDRVIVIAWNDEAKCDADIDKFRDQVLETVKDVNSHPSLKRGTKLIHDVLFLPQIHGVEKMDRIYHQDTASKRYAPRP
jgi:hypothetical protein